MKKIVLFIIVVLIISFSGYIIYIKTNKTGRLEIQKEDARILSPKDLNPKSFITLFKKKYNKDSKLNFITMNGDFPENWVKPEDVQYLISIMNSKEKCCGFMHFYSSFISDDNAEVGGFAIIFLNSYISKTKINLGLNSNPKTDADSIKKIETWYQTK